MQNYSLQLVCFSIDDNCNICLFYSSVFRGPGRLFSLSINLLTISQNVQE